MEEVEYELCVNCKKEIPHKNYVMHTAHCARNITLCPDCKEPVLKTSFEEHKRRHGAIKKTPVVAPKPVSNGTTTWKNKAVNSEPPPVLGHSASKSLLACKYCDLELPKLELDEHEKYCGTRTDKCNECGEFVMFKYKKLHEDSNHGFIKLSDEPGPRASWDSTTTRTRSSTTASDALYSRRSTLPPLRPFDMTPLYDMMDYMPPSNADLAGSMRSKRKEQQEYKDMSRRLDCKTEYIKNLLHDSASITVPLRSSGTAPRNHFYHDRDIGTSSSETSQSSSAAPKTHYNHNKDPVTNSAEPTRSNVPMSGNQTRGVSKSNSSYNRNADGVNSLEALGNFFMGVNSPGGAMKDYVNDKNASANSSSGTTGGPFDEYKKSNSNFVQKQNKAKPNQRNNFDRQSANDNRANFSTQRTDFSNFDNRQSNRGKFNNQKGNNNNNRGNHNCRGNQRGNFQVGDNLLFPRDNFYNPNNHSDFVKPRGNYNRNNASRKPRGNSDNFYNPTFNPHDKSKGKKSLEPFAEAFTNENFNRQSFNNRKTKQTRDNYQNGLVDIKYVTDDSVNAKSSNLSTQQNCPSKRQLETFGNNEFTNVQTARANFELPSQESSKKTVKTDYPVNNMTNHRVDRLDGAISLPRNVVQASKGEFMNVHTAKANFELPAQESSKKTVKTDYPVNNMSNPRADRLYGALSLPRNVVQAFEGDFMNVNTAKAKFEFPTQESSKKTFKTDYPVNNVFNHRADRLDGALSLLRNVVQASEGPPNSSKGAKPKITGPAPQPPHRRRNPPTELTIPCEFCDTPIPHEELIQHETGCRPDLARFNPRRRSPEDDDYFVAPPAAQQPASPEVELPCEFCSDLIPASQLLVHQAKCN